jgi:protein O-mannosyl-transferase
MSAASNEIATPAGRRPYLAVALAIALVTLIAYCPVFRNGFIDLDDPNYITSNPEIPKGLTAETFRWAWTTTRHAYWHPLTWLSLLADVSMFGYCAWGMHLTNLVLHIATSVGLFLVLARMTEELWPSAATAALFAVHPMHVESVAWAAERKDVLSTLFLVLTIASYAAAARRPSFGRHVLTSVLFTLGLLAKPMLVTLPFGLLLLDIWPLRRTNLTDRDPRFPRRSWFALVAEKLPLFALAFGFSLWTFRLQRDMGAVISLKELPWGPRLANVFDGYLWYLKTTFVPIDLAVFHSPRLAVAPLETVVSALVLVGITLFLAWRVRTQPALLVGWLWFCGTLFPVSGIAQSGMQAHADRFSYVPHIGLFVALVWGGAALCRRLRIGPKIVGAALAALLLVCVTLSVRQVTLWRDTDTLFRHALAVTTDNYWLNAMLGEYCWVGGRYPESLEHLEAATALDDKHDGPFNVLGHVNVKLRRFPEAERAFRKALDLVPDNPEAIHNLGQVLFIQRKLDEAAATLEGLLAKHPARPETQELLGKVRAAQGRFDEAIACFKRALEMRPDFPEAEHGIGLVELQCNRPGGAETHFQRALEKRPDFPAAWMGLFRAVYRKGNPLEAGRIAQESLHRYPASAAFGSELALALHRMGRLDDARAQYAELERNFPGFAETSARTARRMATSVDDLDRCESLEPAEAAAQATEFAKAWALEPLAVAQAANGQFDEAIATVDRALALPMLSAGLRDELRADREKFVRREALRVKRDPE